MAQVTRRISVATLASGVMALAMPGQAQATPEAQGGSSTDRAEQAFDRAREAVSAGDVRGAIAALERVLQINPDLANIKLELGLLYLRAGQSDLARSYLEAAVTAADAPETARARARAALRTAVGQLGRWNFSGSLYAGAQYQTNPNASPDMVSIAGPFGVPILVAGDRLDVPHGADWSAALSGNIEAAFRIGDQHGTEIVASLGVSQNEYAEQDILDATFLAGRLGPRFYTGAALSPSGYVQPFVSGAYLALDGRGYYASYGAGVGFQQQLSLNLTLSGQFGYEWRDYKSSATRQTAPDQTGDYWLGLLDGAYQISPRLRPHVGFLIERVAARRDFWSRVSFGPVLGLAAALDPPIGARPWVARLDGEYRHSRYDDADPLVAPGVRRSENQYELTAILSVPLARSLTFDLRAQQTWNRSNLPNYRYDNSLGSIGVSYRF